MLKRRRGTRQTVSGSQRTPLWLCSPRSAYRYAISPSLPSQNEEERLMSVTPSAGTHSLVGQVGGRLGRCRNGCRAEETGRCELERLPPDAQLIKSLTPFPHRRRTGSTSPTPTSARFSSNGCMLEARRVLETCSLCRCRACLRVACLKDCRVDFACQCIPITKFIARNATMARSLSVAGQ
jgi:hypothetical protein